VVQAGDFALDRVLASAFAGSGEFRPTAALRELLQRWGDVYDGEVVSLPLAPDVPPDVVSVLLPNQDGSLRIELSRARANAVWLRNDGAEDSIETIFSQFAQRLATIAETQKVNVGRLGAVVTRGCSLGDPGRAIATQFCRDVWLHGPLNRPEGFELHAHKTFDLLEQLRVNSWVRIRTAKSTPALDHHDSVILEQDINTLTQEIANRRLSREDSIRFFQSAAHQSEVILNLYFPSPQESVDA